MLAPRTTFHDYAPARSYAKQLGLIVDEPSLVEADLMFRAYKLDENQGNQLVMLQMRLMKKAFTPASYPYLARLAIAAMFIFGKGKR